MNTLSRLRWQCRRGTKELDFLLLRYLDTSYVQADELEQGLFIELLKREDDVLIGCLLGDVKLAGMEGLVGKVRVAFSD